MFKMNVKNQGEGSGDNIVDQNKVGRNVQTAFNLWSINGPWFNDDATLRNKGQQDESSSRITIPS